MRFVREWNLISNFTLFLIMIFSANSFLFAEVKNETKVEQESSFLHASSTLNFESLSNAEKNSVFNLGLFHPEKNNKFNQNWLGINIEAIDQWNRLNESTFSRILNNVDKNIQNEMSDSKLMLLASKAKVQEFSSKDMLIVNQIAVKALESVEEDSGYLQFESKNSMNQNTKSLGWIVTVGQELMAITFIAGS